MHTPMYDFISANVKEMYQGNLVKEPNAVIAAYGTGSPDIAWSVRQTGLFPHIPIVTIDQGFTGSPILHALVRDVERGAWSLDKAVAAPWPVTTPVIYCSRVTIPGLVKAGWKHGVWLAEPGYDPSLPAPVFPGIKIVGVQYDTLNGAYDKSVLYDDTWIYGFSVTPQHLAAIFGWGPAFNHTWELLIQDSFGNMTKRMLGTNHAIISLPAGEYTAMVRVEDHSVWSQIRKFEVLDV